MNQNKEISDIGLQLTPFVVLVLTGTATAFSTGLIKLIEFAVKRLDKKLDSKEIERRHESHEVIEERRALSEERDKARRELSEDLEKMRHAYCELRGLYEDIATKYQELMAKHSELMSDYQEIINEVAYIKLEKAKLERDLGDIRSHCENCTEVARKQLKIINKQIRDEM